MGSWAQRSILALAALAIGPVAAAQSSPPAVQQRGRAIYVRDCAGCHGTYGEGARDWQRPDTHGEMPPPPHNRKGHTWKHSDEMLYRIVQEGWRDPFNKTDRLTMPAFKSRLSHDETVAVIAYLKSLWSPGQRRFQAEESRGHPFPHKSP